MSELEELINKACPDLREITFHTDRRVIAKTGGKAKYPRRLYSNKHRTKHKNWSEKTIEVLQNLIRENMSLKEQLQKEIDKPLEDFLGKADADFQREKDEDESINCYHSCSGNCRRVGCNCEHGEWHTETQ